MNLFELRGKLKGSTRTILEIIGVSLVVLLWHLVTMGENPMVRSGILPSPGSVLGVYGELFTENDLVMNICRSLGLNLAGYIEALALSLFFGFLVGLLPLFRGLLQRQVDALRYVPLTAVTGLFIIWFGLDTDMKVHFLAFGIMLYLLPVVVQRIDEVDSVYLKTVYTLGATGWQTIWSVYVPSVLSKLSDDIRVLTAISWTYIIIAESLGNQGGIGALIWRAGQRQGRVDKVFALLIVIILIGIIQDKLFVYLDKKLFPHKYQANNGYSNVEAANNSSFDAFWDFFLKALSWLLLGVYLVLFIDEFFSILPTDNLLSYLFGDTVWVVHFLFVTVVAFKVWKTFNRRNIASNQNSPIKIKTEKKSVNNNEETSVNIDDIFEIRETREIKESKEIKEAREIRRIRKNDKD